MKCKYYREKGYCSKDNNPTDVNDMGECIYKNGEITNKAGVHCSEGKKLFNKEKSLKKCEVCGKLIENESYQVMIYREDGKQEFVQTDCKDCALELRHKNFALHQRRADDVINQSIQRLK